MTRCIYCGARVERSRRTIIERLASRAAYRCPGCGNRSHVFRSVIAFFQMRCACPLCGNVRLTKLASVDRIDKLTANPVRRFLGLLRAPLYHCTFCRYQFYDVRRPAAVFDGSSQDRSRDNRKPVAVNSGR